MGGIVILAKPISVVLDHSQWMYFLGWCEGKRQPAETETLRNIFLAIQNAIRDEQHR